MRRAQKGPLQTDILKTPHEELTKAPGRLDLAEDRFDNLLAQPGANNEDEAKLANHLCDRLSGSYLFCSSRPPAKNQS